MAYWHLMSWRCSLLMSKQPSLIQAVMPAIASLACGSRLGSLRWLSLSSLLLVVACDKETNNSQFITQNLVVPERNTPVYITDQVTLAGQAISLWFDHGRCQLQVDHPKLKRGPFSLQPNAPCFFIKSPGTETVQVYQRDKVSRVLAVVGTPTTPTASTQRCGTEIQGIVLNAAGTVSVSNTLQRGSLRCADQGLDNAQYELLARD